MLNQQIGPYKIISKLGEGGMANVYLAEKGSLQKKVALKVLKDEFLSNQHIRNRFLSEAKKMSGLNHANIVGVHDLIDENDFVAIELDYVEGKTLKQHLHEKGALPDEEIESLFKQMLDAVGYVHENGFVHRDVKPSNFMLTTNGIIKLTDFGIAKNVDDSNIDYTGTGTGMQMGTPKYMSPEQVRSTKDVDHRTDIYSLGVVLWEMVTGKVPYDIHTSSTFDVFRKIVDESLEKTNTRWDEVIQKATKKVEFERYQWVQDIKLLKQDGKDINALTFQNKKSKYLIVTFLIIGVLGFLLLRFQISQRKALFNNQENNVKTIQNQNTEIIDSLSEEMIFDASMENQDKTVKEEYVDNVFSFKEYCNSRFEFCIKYPSSKLIPQGESGNGDGQIFKTKNGLATMWVYRDFRDNISDDEKFNIESVFIEDSGIDNFNQIKREVTYKKLGKDFYVISGYNNGRIFYQKTANTKKGLVTALIEYPESEKQYYNTVSETIFKSLR